MIGRTMALAALALAFALPAPALAGDAAAGKTTFETNCASCHGTGGKGDGPVGLALDPKPRDFTVGEFKFDTDGDGGPGTDADLEAVITQGAMKFGGSPLMAPWPTLSEEQVTDVIAHIRSLKAADGAAGEARTEHGGAGYRAPDWKRSFGPDAEAQCYLDILVQ